MGEITPEIEIEGDIEPPRIGHGVVDLRVVLVDEMGLPLVELRFESTQAIVVVREPSSNDPAGFVPIRRRNQEFRPIERVSDNNQWKQKNPPSATTANGGMRTSGNSPTVSRNVPTPPTTTPHAVEITKIEVSGVDIDVVPRFVLFKPREVLLFAVPHAWQEQSVSDR